MKPWSEMSPRERDALVAEKVMGWARCEDVNCDGCDCPIMTVGVGEVYIRHPDTGTLGWSPTTDIAAAWEVVEKMRDEGFLVEVSTGNTTTVSLVGNGEGIWNVIAPTAPEAICLAALRASGVDV